MSSTSESNRGPRPTHACPGCGRPGVPHHMFACKPCWYRLPVSLREPITEGYRHRWVDDGHGHHAAMAEAREWYSANPREEARRVLDN